MYKNFQFSVTLSTKLYYEADHLYFFRQNTHFGTLVIVSHFIEKAFLNKQEFNGNKLYYTLSISLNEENQRLKF